MGGGGGERGASDCRFSGRGAGQARHMYMCMVAVSVVGVGRAGGEARAIADLVAAAAGVRGSCVFCARLLWLWPGRGGRGAEGKACVICMMSKFGGGEQAIADLVVAAPARPGAYICAWLL